MSLRPDLLQRLREIPREHRASVAGYLRLRAEEIRAHAERDPGMGDPSMADSYERAAWELEQPEESK